MLSKKNSPSDQIASRGAELIQDGMTIFTYCYSRTVLAVFKKAKQQGKNFTVICSETRPNFTGRIMAQKLAQLKIRVILTPDSSALQNLDQSDLFLFGADVITRKGKIINKSGTALMVFLAKSLGVPAYVCASLEKFGTTKQARILLAKKRPDKEMLDNPLRGVELNVPAYDEFSIENVDGLIIDDFS